MLRRSGCQCRGGKSKLVECIVISVIVSVVCNRILAIHTFKVIDGYVKSIIDMAKESIRNTYFDK